MTPLRAQHEIRLAALFSPLTLTLLLYGPLLLLYAVSSSSVFRTEFGSRKALSTTGFLFFAFALVVFAVGAHMGARAAPTARRPDPDLSPSRRRSLAVLLEAALIASLGAYAVWFARGILNAGGVAELFEIWRTDPHRVKAEIMTTVPGVTTMTQLAVAAVPLVIAFGLYRRGSALRILVVTLVVLAVARAVLFNERLALIELVVPIVYLVAAPRRLTVPRVALFAAAFAASALTLFAVTELRRTYVYTDDFSAARASTRFLGYYLTSINNGMVVVDEYPARTPFYASGEMLWLFPGLRDLRLDHLPVVGNVSLAYSDLAGVDPERFWPRAFATQGLDYEFNVFTAPGYLAADFGWAALIAVLLLGILSGRLYRQAERSPFHRAFYAVWLVGLLELMRILYVANVRVFPAYLVLGAAYLVVRRSAPATRRRAPLVTAGSPAQ
jgi:oligosaccharide repeat unit polymerase